MKKQLISNTQNVDKNKKLLATWRKRSALWGQRAREMAKDDKQIDEVKKYLEKFKPIV